MSRECQPMTTDPPSLARCLARHVEVPLGLVACLALIVAGLSLPVMSIEKLVFWEDSYSIIDGVISLQREGYYLLAAIIFVFSVVFPNLKLIALAVTWFAPLTPDSRDRALWWMKILGKWSMLDVFVVAVTIVLSRSSAVLDAEPRFGLYLFAGGVLLSLVVAIWIDVLARRASTPRSGGLRTRA